MWWKLFHLFRKSFTDIPFEVKAVIDLDGVKMNSLQNIGVVDMSDWIRTTRLINHLDIPFYNLKSPGLLQELFTIKPKNAVGVFLTHSTYRLFHYGFMGYVSKKMNNQQIEFIRDNLADFSFVRNEDCPPFDINQFTEKYFNLRDVKLLTKPELDWVSLSFCKPASPMTAHNFNFLKYSKKSPGK